MTPAMYATVWAALACFVLAEQGKTQRSGPAGWVLPVSLTGAVLMTTHVLLALATRYAWNHEHAIAETARQAGAVYGFEWRGNIFVSYAFVVLWFFDAWRWRAGTSRSRGVTTAFRLFFLVIIFNGAVVFASPAGRIAGVVLVAALVWAWRPGPQGHPVASRVRHQ